MLSQSEVKTCLWKENGYDDFADGMFGNGGQNLYVSAGGVLQRIHRYDLDRDGYFDLLFVNAQDMGERPPVYIYEDILGNDKRIELPTAGAYAAAVADLDGNGYDDLIIANQCNGVHSDVTAYIYWGSCEGYSEKYRTELPAPDSRSVAVGDFNGDGLKDIVFVCGDKIRVFYQGENGFRADKYYDIDLHAMAICAYDIDGDGFADVYMKDSKGRALIIWGSPRGLHAEQSTILNDAATEVSMMCGSTPSWLEYVEGWRPRVLTIKNTKFLFSVDTDKAILTEIKSDRTVGELLTFDCSDVVSVAAGDISGNGFSDLFFACSKLRPDREPSQPASSWIYYADDNGDFSLNRRAEIKTLSARDAVICDLNGNGYGDLIIAQGGTDVLYTTESLVFKADGDGLAKMPLRFETHDATCVLTLNNPDKKPYVAFVNHVSGRVRGDVNAYIYHGSKNGYSPVRRTELPVWAAPDAICCDFNDDGWPDIFISNCSENAPHLDPGSFLYWGCPQGFSPDNKTIFPTVRAHGSAVGDFSHRGYLDVAVAGFWNHQLLIFRQNENGFDLDNPVVISLDPEGNSHKPVPGNLFRHQPSQWMNSEYSNPRWLFAADFNGNGWLDLFVSQIAGGRSLILHGGPDGFSMQRATWLNVEGASFANAADLNGNGWLDLVVAGHQCMGKKYKYESYVYIYWGGPDGYSDSRRTQLPVNACNSIAIADFNNDGRLDIFASSYNAGRHRDCDSFIYWQNERGEFSADNRQRLFTHSACGCVAADFNEDGYIDLAVASHKARGNHVANSQIWWNGPDGFCEKNITNLPTKGPHGMQAVDPGNIMDRSAEEFYISNPKKLETKSRHVKISWQADVPPKTWVKAQIRFAESCEKLEKADWIGYDGAGTWFDNNAEIKNISSPVEWVQYRLALGSVNGMDTPRVKSVEISYLQHSEFMCHSNCSTSER